jgi:hypothetical protein
MAWIEDAIAIGANPAGVASAGSRGRIRPADERMFRRWSFCPWEHPKKSSARFVDRLLRRM